MNKIRQDCPYCGAVKKFCIFPSTGTYYCYRCSKWGPYEGGLGSNLGEATLSEKKFTHGTVLEGFRLLAEDSIGVKYLRSRGIDPKPLYPFIGTWKNYLVFPFYNKGSWEYYVGRKMYGSGPRYRNASVSGSRIFVPYDFPAEVGRLIVVEGIFDTLKVGQATGLPSIATLGTAFTHQKILEIICHTQSDTVIEFMFDPGAYFESLEFVNSLSALRRVALIPLDESDPGDMSGDEIRERIDAPGS